MCDAGGGGTAVQAPQFVRNIPGQTFDHGMDIFTVPGSGGNCLLWTPARGGPLRMGQPDAME